MAHIIGLVQVKGGAGRSTVAANLAGEFALVDCYIGGSYSRFFARGS